MKALLVAGFDPFKPLFYTIYLEPKWPLFLQVNPTSCCKALGGHSSMISSWRQLSSLHLPSSQRSGTSTKASEDLAVSHPAITSTLHHTTWCPGLWQEVESFLDYCIICPAMIVMDTFAQTSKLCFDCSKALFFIHPENTGWYVAMLSKKGLAPKINT